MARSVDVEFHDMRRFSPYLLEMIERKQEHAIVYDMEDNKWDLYVFGKRRGGRYNSQREAVRLMTELLNEEYGEEVSF